MLVTSLSFAYEAPHAVIAPTIDGRADDAAWQAASWYAIDQLTLGVQPESEDFSGRFKLVWTEKKLYLLAEITDDVIIDTHPNPLVNYWDDDTLEVFIDEDKSGGEHRISHNAFAYHVSIDNHAIDYSTKDEPAYYTDHISSAWQRDVQQANTVFWEVSFDIYPDTFKDENNTAIPVTLKAGKEMGFMVAYCDSDNDSDGRQSFISSKDVPAVDGDKNRGYKDASVFAVLTLVKHAK